MLLFNTLVRVTAELSSARSQAQKIRHIVPLFVAFAIVGICSVLNLIMCPQIENVVNQSFFPLSLIM